MKGTLKYSYSLEKIEVIPAEGNKPMSLKASVKNLGNAIIKAFNTVTSLCMVEDGDEPAVDASFMMEVDGEEGKPCMALVLRNYLYSASLAYNY